VICLEEALEAVQDLLFYFFEERERERDKRG